MTPRKKAKEVTSPEVAPTSTFTPWTANIEAALADKENAVPFVDETTSAFPNIVLPGNAFFDQELWDVIFNKLMKAPVKDYQVLLRLSKLWKTINDISHKLALLRDAISKDCELDELAKQETALTPETLNSPEYQAKSMAFGAMIQGYIFSKRISLAPLGTLTLDLTNPDGHARAFLEGSNLSADDIDMLNGLGIVKVIYPEADASQTHVDEPAVPESNETLPAEEVTPAPEAEQATEDALVPDETPDEQN